MRLSVEHTETFTYDPPSLGTIQVLRMTPRDHTGHYVCEWSVDVDADCNIETKKDAFGNITSSFSLSGPLESVTITTRGEVETEDTHGIVRGAIEKIPSGVYLRSVSDEAFAPLVRTLLNANPDAQAAPLAQMHALNDALHAALPNERSADEVVDASHGGQQQVQSASTGATQEQQSDMPANASSENPAAQRLRALIAERAEWSSPMAAMLLCQAARRLGFPARMVSGYRLTDEPETSVDARAIWIEAEIEQLGWVAFDPLERNCPSEDTVRVAVGLSQTDVQTTRFGHYGSEPTFQQKSSIRIRRMNR